MEDDKNQAEVDGSQHLFASESRDASAAACQHIQPQKFTAILYFGEDKSRMISGEGGE